MTLPSGFLSVRDFAARERISLSRAYQLVSYGLPCERIGGIRAIDVQAADTWRAERRERVGRPSNAVIAARP